MSEKAFFVKNVNSHTIELLKEFLLTELEMPFIIKQNWNEGILNVANCDEQKTRLTLEILGMTVVKHIPSNTETEFLFKY